MAAAEEAIASAVPGPQGPQGATGAEGGQYVPAVGGTFTSSYFTSNIATANLRDRNTAPMPLCVAEAISVDQASFNVPTVATTAGQTAKLDLVQLVGATWTLVTALATGIALTGSTGVRTASFAPVALTPGVVYGLRLSEEQAYDTALRVTAGTMVGPGIGTTSGFGSGFNLPLGANTATVTAVPVIRLRRSA